MGWEFIFTSQQMTLLHSVYAFDNINGTMNPTFRKGKKKYRKNKA